MKTMLIGYGVDILPYAPDCAGLNQSNWFRNMTGWKMMANELIENIGSFFEMGRFILTGRVPAYSDKTEGEDEILRMLKKSLLFEIESAN